MPLPLPQNSFTRLPFPKMPLPQKHSFPGALFPLSAPLPQQLKASNYHCYVDLNSQTRFQTRSPSFPIQARSSFPIPYWWRDNWNNEMYGRKACQLVKEFVSSDSDQLIVFNVNSLSLSILRNLQELRMCFIMNGEFVVLLSFNQMGILFLNAVQLSKGVSLRIQGGTTNKVESESTPISLIHTGGLEWKFSQVFGERAAGEEVQEE
ncbi:hypothetical protein Ccrd_023828 [Cynara cardunculus var. scolymus]|uniref:Uncharacterized protein n=1 Tax=Cynara cardunculus var. scolymus TaxID=59895 RepID=A0A103XW43_CYNCS|nr:hypothetical protein Ccrd_023828 [Cynara cardunculus var. scolymus]